LLDKDNATRWERLAELRVTLGEQLLLVLTKKGDGGMPKEATEKIASLLSEWDKHNVFGGPTLIHQLKRAATTGSPEKKAPPVKQQQKEEKSPPKDETDQPPPIPKEEEEDSKPAPKKIDEKKAPPSAPLVATTAATTEPSSPPAPSSTRPPLTTTHSAAQLLQTYDFDSKGIPERTVEPREFLEPCRAIATLQIARDLRNDNAVQLSSLLQSMPQDVRAVTAETAENNGVLPAALSDETFRDFTKRTADALIDTDLPEALQNVRQLRDILQKQSEARQQLLDLLIASRCQFGAEQAAAAFESIDVAELERRHQVLADAMELEGLDIDEEERKYSKGKDKEAANLVDEEFPPLPWYLPSKEANKRQKVE